MKSLLLLLFLGAGLLAAAPPFPAWSHSASIFILTTPKGADLPANASVQDFPLLVRLHRDHFPFDEAASDGRDVRFSVNGTALPYEIDHWDTADGVAALWVRVPEIQGNARQEITIHWGRDDVESASDGKAVFDASNGYLGVWHLGSEVREVLGNFDSQDRGTKAAPGLIGEARGFDGAGGISGGRDLRILPQGAAPHSTQGWFRAETANGRLVCWGNEKRAGKVQMTYQSPPGVGVDCYFSAGNVRSRLPQGGGEWTQAVHTYEDGQAVLYLNGVKQVAGNPRAGAMALERPAGLWLGGWYDRYDFSGALDEVRISKVARSAEWVRLEYENQKEQQTLVGPVVQEGSDFSVSPASLTIQEGESVELLAKAGGAQKVTWFLERDGRSSVLATNRFRLSFDAGRVRGGQSFQIRFEAVEGGRTRSLEIPVTVTEHLPEPEFSLSAPSAWDGRESIEIRPTIENLAAMEAAGVGALDFSWEVSGVATLKEEKSDSLVLRRAQGSGHLRVTLSLANGGEETTQSTNIVVREPQKDLWVARVAGDEEMPGDGQFYARKDGGKGTLHCRGRLSEKAEEVFLRVFADERAYAVKKGKPKPDGSYALQVDLEAALVKYRVEFGTLSEGRETILHRAGDLLCGDAFLIAGQSNALATDTREESPRVINEWLRSYGQRRFFKEGERENLWCRPVWKANNPEKKEYLAELGWWGMELGKGLVESQQVPIFLLNGARGGTRIDQHQRNDADPTDPDTIYGRLLWRLQQARLTHGIRAVLWHQGENDQGAAGPDGDYGWKNYQRYFVEMSADWKRDFPNLSRYYVFQIWPNACSMGGGI